MSDDREILKKRLSECEEELARTRELLLIDPVTGFFNERGFLRALSAEISRCLREGSFLALTLAEIQNLESVENLYGLYGVQKVLTFVAEHLKRHLRDYDLLGITPRNHLWIVSSIRKSGEGARLAQRIYRLLNEISYDDGELVFPLRSAVITRIVCGGATPGELLNQSLKLLPEARLAREPLILLGGETPRQKTLEREVFRTIARGELAIALQPVINIQTRKTVFYEVLARFVSEEDTFSAGTFMPSVEHLGLFEEMDRQILYKAMVLLKESPEIGRVAVNISQEYALRDLANEVLEWTRSLEIYPQDLILEINERKSHFSPLALSSKLNFLKAEGFTLSLDDFGVESANLFLLRDIPWDLVKVDGRFVRGLLTNDFDRKVLRFLSDCAALLGFRLVAEQVEEERILKEVARFGVLYAQGFYCGEPEIIPETRLIKPPRRD